MSYADLDDLLARGRAALARGPVALIFSEDGIELASTLAHHRRLGFRTVVLFAPLRLRLEGPAAEGILRVGLDTSVPGAVFAAVNRVIGAVPDGTWLYYAYNAEYLLFPFCETRTVGELLAFHTEERREAMITYVIDLYAADLSAAPNAVDRDDAHLDRAGYYALARRDRWGNLRERQLDFFGGLRWRFEEHVPPARRRIDRVGLFRARPGLALREDHTLTDEEMNTYACPWHHNLTAAICSFRTAKALRTNPGSRDAIATFHWHNSVRFGWNSQQLMDLGLMEPGQWF
ncbi:MAG: hypothetical protein KJZ85_14490 [Rhodobacteraceae bacterium]|jgi:hypothetical protein|nr:hypothetical protein [Paracoccaceae bacterium]